MTRLKLQSLELESVRTGCHTDRSWDVQDLSPLYKQFVLNICLSKPHFSVKMPPNPKSLEVESWRNELSS